MNEDNGKKLLIGGGAIVLGSILLNQIYMSGFQAGLVAGGGDPGAIARYGHDGFPGGLFFLLAIGGFIWWKVSNGGKRGPGGGFFSGRRGIFDDRRQHWPQPYQQHFNHQQYGQQYAAPQQSSPSQAPGAAPQPPAGYGASPQQPPVSSSPPMSAPGHPQPDPNQPPAPPAAADPNKPVI